MAVAAVTAVARAQSEGGARTVRLKSELSVYTDTDAVTVVTPSAGASLQDQDGGWFAKGSYLADIVSAASVDIVSTASSRWQEVRHAGALSATYKPGTVATTAVASASYEPDYVSLLGGGGVGLELASKTVNPAFSYAYSHDTAGLSGTPFSVFSHELSRHAAAASAELVMAASTTLVLGADGVLESGNSAKPYRFLPLFAPEIAPSIPAGASVELVNRERLPGRASEQLPHTRWRAAVSARLSHRFTGSTLLASQRLYADDWGLRASTTDLRFVLDVGQRFFPWVHVRVHLQSGVDFWRRAYAATYTPTGVVMHSEFRTGDRELGPVQAGTIGAGAAWDLGASTRPLRLLGQADVGFTAFSDALFIKQRQAFLGVLQVEAEF